MKINKIEIENYRNIKKISVDFDDVNIIWGKNAQGKTNLIEAIYLFTGARSFRGSKDSELIRFGCEGCSLNIEFTGSQREQTAQITVDKKKKATLNGIKKNPSELGNEIKAVVFSPVHLSMVKDGPAERRNFVDGALCQLKSNYRRLLKEYKRSLQQRNSLLKDLAKHPELENMLYIWNRELAKNGAKIVFQRLKYIEALQPYIDDIFSGISYRQEKMKLKYSVDYPHNIEKIEKMLLKAFDDNKLVDIVNKITTKGPHREDIEILINDKSARSYASQGQQRSCVLAMKLAEAALLEKMTGIEPVALLDDVMSELDEARQDYILNHIKNHQLFITCCDKNTVLKLKKGKTIHIENGCITEE